MMMLLYYRVQESLYISVEKISFRGTQKIDAIVFQG